MSRRICFILAATDTGPMILNRMDFDPRNGGGVGNLILEHGNYEINEIMSAGQIIAGLRQTRGEGVVIIDGGANIGTNTIPWAQATAPWGSVIAVEPQERIFYALCGNIALNNCANARAFKAVLGREAGEMDIPEYDHTLPTNFGGVHMQGECDPGQKPCRHVKCKVMAIDDLSLTRLDFLKLDIEGMEPAALHGARKTIARTKPVIHLEHNIAGIASCKLHLDGYEIFMAGMNALCVPQGDKLLKMIKMGPPPPGAQPQSILKAS